MIKDQKTKIAKSRKKSRKLINMGNLMKEYTKDLSALQEGNEIEGTVIKKGIYALFLDLSPWGLGIIYKNDERGMPYNFSNIKIGDKITATIIQKENPEGYIELALKGMRSSGVWEPLIEHFEKKTSLKARVISANKGGLILQAYGIEGFLPASQLGQEHYPRVEDGDEAKILRKLMKLEGMELEVKVIDVNPKESKLIFSEKATEEKDIKKALAKYKEGDIVEGLVSGVVDFGIFVKFGKNLEGLVHISELGWKLIENPRDMYSVGDKIKAKIIDISGTQVSLSVKALQKNPWEGIEKKYKVGEVYKGEVKTLKPFGAFVYLDKDIHGLAYIAQFGNYEKMSRLLEPGKKYKFKITSMRPSEHRMGLKLVS